MIRDTQVTYYAPAERAPQPELLRQFQLWDALNQVHLLMDAVPQGMVIVNGFRQIVFANKAFSILIGENDLQNFLGKRVGETLQCVHSRETLGGCGTSRFCRECGAVNAILSGLDGIPAVEECYVQRFKNLEKLELRVWTSPADLHEERYTIFTIQDIHLEKENARLLQKVQHLAVTDPLTGILNRRQFFELAERELNRAVRHQTTLSAAIFDLDLFKEVNDTHGHQAGDAVLIESVNRMCKEIRATDVFARYGGDEFVLLMPDTSYPEALQVITRIQDSLSSRSVHYENKSLHVSASAGVAVMDGTTNTSIEMLLEQADRELYVQKRTRKGRV